MTLPLVHHPRCPTLMTAVGGAKGPCLCTPTRAETAPFIPAARAKGETVAASLTRQRCDLDRRATVKDCRARLKAAGVTTWAPVRKWALEEGGFSRADVANIHLAATDAYLAHHARETAMTDA